MKKWLPEEARAAEEARGKIALLRREVRRCGGGVPSKPRALHHMQGDAVNPLPTLFLSHGSPMHAVQAGDASAAWGGPGASLPRPRAVLIASAHWESSVPMLTGSEELETIHDFRGFPEALYEIRYP